MGEHLASFNSSLVRSFPLVIPAAEIRATNRSPWTGVSSSPSDPHPSRRRPQAPAVVAAVVSYSTAARAPVDAPGTLQVIPGVNVRSRRPNWQMRGDFPSRFIHQIGRIGGDGVEHRWDSAGE